jgi:hypothetical protein
VEKKKHVGCDAFFADGALYALVWKDGRLALKLPDPRLRSGLEALPGAQAWKQAAKGVEGDWVLVDEKVHGKAGLLKDWVAKAHGLAYGPAAAKRVEGRLADIRKAAEQKNRQKFIPRNRIGK